MQRDSVFWIPSERYWMTCEPRDYGCRNRFCMPFFSRQGNEDNLAIDPFRPRFLSYFENEDEDDRSPPPSFPLHQSLKTYAVIPFSSHPRSPILERHGETPAEPDPLQTHLDVRIGLTSAMQHCSMKTVTVSKRGTFTIPPELRCRLGLSRKGGDLLVIEEREGGLLLTKAVAVPVRDIPKDQILQWIREDEAAWDATRHRARKLQ